MRRSTVFGAMACAAVAAVINPLFAATPIDWANNTASTDWATGASWVGGAAPANDLTSDIASFTTSATGSNPTLSADESINGLSINTAAAAWTLSSSNGYNSVTYLAVGAGGISLTGSNTATISAYLSLPSNTAFTVATGSNLVLSNTVEGSGGFTLNDNSALGDAGEVTLSGYNLFNGPVVVWSGTLNLENNHALGSGTSSLTVSGNINGPDEWAGTVNVSGGVDIQSGGAITLESHAYNTNVLTSSSGNNTINNLIHVLGEDIANPFTGAQENYNTIDNLVAGTTLTLTGGIDSDENPGVSVSFNGPGNVAVTNTINVGTPISGYTYASLTKMGTGTLLLSASNSMGGQVLIQDGAISVNQFAALGAGSTAGLVLGMGGTTGTSGILQYTGSAPDTLLRPISFAATGTLGGEFDNNSTNYSIATLNAGVALGGATFTVGGLADTNLSGVSGTGNVVKSSSSNLNLSGSNGFTGTLTINAGNVLTTSDNALGGSVTVSLANSAATNFNLNNTNQTIANLQGGGATGGNVQLGNQTLTLVSGTGSFAGAISGAGNILVNGADQNLTGTNNTYSGNVTIQSGSLGISSASNLSPNSAPVLIESGGTLVLNANINVPTAVIDPTSTGTVALGADNNQITAIGGNTWLGAAAGSYTLSSASLAAGNGNVYRLGGGEGSLTISTGALSDAGGTPNSVIVAAAVELDGNNTYTGATTVDGTLTATNLANAGTASSIGESGMVNLSANGWFSYEQSTATSVSTNTNFNISGGSDDYGGIVELLYVNSKTMTLTLTGNITSTDNSSVHLWGSNSLGVLTGTINLGSGSNGGILYVDRGGTWDFGSSSGTETVTASQIQVSSGTLGTDGNVDFQTPVNIIDEAQSKISTGTGNYTATFEQGISTSTSTFTRSGTGTMILNGASTMNGGTGTFTNSAGNLTVNGTLSGNFTNSGGDTVFAASSTLTGNVTLSGGTTQFTDIDHVPNTKLTISSGVLETQNAANGDQFTRKLGASAGQVAWTSGGFSAVGGDLTINIDGTATPTTLTLGSSSSFVAIGGTMSFGSAAADHTVQLENPLVLTSSSKSGTLTVSVTAGVGSTPEVQFDGAISDNSSKAGSLIKTGTGTLLLTNSKNSYHGSTAITGGSLFIGASDTVVGGAATTGALGSGTAGLSIGSASGSTAFEVYGADVTTTRAINVTAGSTAVTLGAASANTGTFSGAVTLGSSVNLNAVSGGNAIFDGAISGSGGITKIGAGTATLAAANSYQGNTNIQAGTLVVSSGGSISNSPQVNISPGATLAGSGTVNGNVNLAGNLGGSLSIKGNLSGSGTITPGDAPGILTAGSLTASAMNFNFEFSQSGSPDYSDPTNSGNDVLDLTAGSNPFTHALTSSDTINIYLDSSALTGGDDTLRGGFFTNDDASFLSEIDGATINYYIQNAGGTTAFDGNDYSMLSPSQYSVSISTVSDTADFAGSSGAITGEVTQINLTSAVPLPSAASAGVLLLGGLAAAKRRRRK